MVVKKVMVILWLTWATKMSPHGLQWRSMVTTGIALEVETHRVGKEGLPPTCPHLRDQHPQPKTRTVELVVKASQEHLEATANQVHPMVTMLMESHQLLVCLATRQAFLLDTEFLGLSFHWGILTRMVCLLAFQLHFQHGLQW